MWPEKVLCNYYVMMSKYPGEPMGTIQKLIFSRKSPYQCLGTYQSIVSSFLGVQSIRWSLDLGLANSSGRTDTDGVRNAGDSGRSHSRDKIIFQFVKLQSVYSLEKKFHEGNIRECCCGQ